jgi:DNA-binding beta-propeller fold protein YncE
MPVPAPVTIATGFADLLGSSYRVTTDQLYVADAGAGTISTVNPHTHAKTVVGTGYHAPSDVVLSVDGLHAYIAERPGSLLRLSLTNMNRAAATVVATGFSGIDQIALDEAHGYAYIAEFTAGHIQRVTLSSGSKTVVATIANPRGVLVTSDGRFLYVSNDAGRITRFDLVTHTHLVVATGLNGPRHLTWADAGESIILFPQPNPTGRVLKADLTKTPATVTEIAGPTSPAPYSVAVLSSNQLLIASATVVAEVDLTASVYSAAGPIFLGIGFVPADATHLPNGYADTTMDPTYFFQVKDCPFGGALPLMINWEHARSSGANFYQVFIEGPVGPPAQVKQAFGDYRWSVPLDEFELITTTPTDPDGYYLLRSPGEIWLNHWLGLLLDTTGRPNGLNKISIKLFSAEDPASEIGSAADPGRFASVMIDNTVPVANLQQILHEPGDVPVDACAIVSTGAPTFRFRVTASAPQSHLLGWSLVAYWGDNKSETVSADNYNNHISPTRLWAGITGVVVPPPGPTPWNATVAGDPTSTHCAHSFFLYAWDRVINGWGYIHGVTSYQKSVTLLF